MELLWWKMFALRTRWMDGAPDWSILKRTSSRLFAHSHFSETLVTAAWLENPKLFRLSGKPLGTIPSATLTIIQSLNTKLRHEKEEKKDYSHVTTLKFSTFPPARRIGPKHPTPLSAHPSADVWLLAISHKKASLAFELIVLDGND